MSSSPLLSHWFRDVYRPLKRKLKAKSTIDEYHTCIKHFTEYLIERDLERGEARASAYVADLTDVSIGGYMAWKALHGAASGTVNKHRRYLMAMAKIACKKKLIPELPDVERETELERDPECWSIDEMETIIASASVMPGLVGDCPARYWWPAIIWLAFNTGYRISALMKIRSTDVDLEAGTVVVRAEQQKDKADQTIDLLPETIAALRVLNLRHLEFVFDDWKHDRGSRQWKTLNKHLKKILARAKLRSTKHDLWHKFRRVFATHICAASNIETARIMCGHSSVNTTLRYIDRGKVPKARTNELLPRPVVARQIKLFQPPSEAS